MQPRLDSRYRPIEEKTQRISRNCSLESRNTPLSNMRYGTGVWRSSRTRKHTARHVEHVRATTRTVQHDGGRASGAFEVSPTPARAVQRARVSAPGARADRLQLREWRGDWWGERGAPRWARGGDRNAAWWGRGREKRERDGARC